MHSTSITLRFCLVITLILCLLGTAGYLLLNNVYQVQLRSQANTVADNVSAFGKWVANYGRVWVNQNSEDSFLGRRDVINLQDALEATQDENGDMNRHAYRFFSKNPALAQREYSEVVAESDSKAKFRLTSDNYMNPANKPDEFESQAIAEIKATNKAFFEVFDTEKNEYRFARPLVHKASCIKCHGSPASAPKDVLDRYGSENGFGFKEGDIAGVISVVLPMTTFAEAALPLIGWQELAMVIAAFVLAILFLQLSVLAPLKNLTREAEAASMGDKLKMDLDHVKQDTRNEIERLGLAIRRLNASTKMAIDQMKKIKKGS